MAMVCPHCGAASQQSMNCPECGGRTVFHDTRRVSIAAWKRGRWMQTAHGRVVIGVLLVQGLFYALRHLFTGIMLLLDETNNPAQIWTSPRGLLCLDILQVLVVVVGAMLAGAGHRSGTILGGVVGAAQRHGDAGTPADVPCEHPCGRL